MENTTTENSLVETMRNLAPTLTKKQSILASYIIANYKEVAFMNSKTLAQKAEVSETTVFRLASSLGYPGFPEFLDALREILQHRMARMEKINIESSGVNRTLLGRVIDMEKKIMSEMESQISDRDFELAVDLILDAPKVFVVGFGADECGAKYLYRFLCVIRPEVHFMSPGDDPRLYESISSGAEKSLAVIYNFPRYNKGAIEVAKAFQENDIRIIGITDNVLAPLAPFANPLLLVPIKYLTYVDPVAAITSLTHALLTGVILKIPKTAKKRIMGYYDFSNKMQRCYWEGIEPEIGIGED